MMITSAQSGDSRNPARCNTKRRKSTPLVQATKQRRQDRYSLDSKSQVNHVDFAFPPFLSPVSSPSTSTSTTWADSASICSRSGSSQTTDIQTEPCIIRTTSVSTLSEQHPTDSYATETRRKVEYKSQSKSSADLYTRQRKQSTHESSPQEITGVLDPFLTLPLELLPDDRMLLQYYLSIGRRVILGTSERPKHDLALDMGSRQIPHCPIHVLACINISEWIICVKSNVGRPPRLYQRIGRAYEIARKILFRSDTSLQTRVAALLNLQMMESALDQKATQAIHLQALDHLVSSEGGFVPLLTKMGAELIAPVDLLGQCMWGIGFQKQQRLAFEAAKTCLFESLATIRDWVDKHSRLLTSNDSVPSDQTQASIEVDDTTCLNPLKNYLRNGINSHLLRPKLGSLAHAPAMFNVLFSICFTLAWLDCSPQTATGLLLKLQKSMQASVTDSRALPGSLSGDEVDNLHVLHPNQIFSSFYHIRRSMTSSHPVMYHGDLLDTDGENYLCSVSIDVARLFSMMSESTRVHLATELFHCAFYNTSSVKHPCFDRDDLSNLEHDLESFWSTLS